MLRKKQTYIFISLFFILLFIIIGLFLYLDSYIKSEQHIVQTLTIPLSANKKLNNFINKDNSPEKKKDNPPSIPSKNSSLISNVKTGHVIDCPLDINEDESNELMALNDNIFSNQLDSNLPNELLGKILFSSDWIQLDKTIEEVQLSRSLLIEALYNYHLDHPREKLAYYRLLTECSQIQHYYCNNDFYQKAKQIDNDNGLVWLTVASLYLIEFNLAEANNALYQATLTNTFSNYFFELIFLHHEITKKYAPLQVNKLLIAGIGYTAATPNGYHKAINHCSKAKVDDHVTLEACLKIGKQMEDNSATIIHSAMGVALQKIYYEKNGNTVKVKEIEDISKMLLTQTSSQQYTKATNLMFHDSQLNEQWINYGLQHGEEKNINYIIDEAIWRSNDPNYNPCPNNLK
jgi:hypothetical protein